jgi:pimeloyl-ACP methyl ester carboxylesterase
LGCADRHAGIRPGLCECLRQGDFQVVAEAGHLPQLEQPAATFALLDAFRME